jgi:hypothetical protein
VLLLERLIAACMVPGWPQTRFTAMAMVGYRNLKEHDGAPQSINILEPLMNADGRK